MVLARVKAKSKVSLILVTYKAKVSLVLVLTTAKVNAKVSF